MAVSGVVSLGASSSVIGHTIVDSGTISTITNVVHIDDNSSSISVDDGGGSITVDGTIAVSSMPAITVDNFPAAVAIQTVAQNTGSNLHTVVDSGNVTASVTFPLIQAVSGSVSLGTSSSVIGHVILDSGTLSTITNVVHMDDNSGSITVDNNGTFAVQSTVSNFPGNQLVSIAQPIAVSGTVLLGASSAVIGHTILDSGTLSTITNVVHIDDNSGNISIDDGGNSITVDGTITVNAGSGTFTIGGDVASGTNDSGNPVKNGAKAINTEATAVTNGQRVNLVADLVGKLITLPYANPENFFNVTSSGDISGTGLTLLKLGAGGSLRYYITAITTSNMHATVSTRIDILDGSTIIWTGPGAAAGGGYTITLPVPLRGSANTSRNIQCATTGATVRGSVSGFMGQ